MKHRKFLFARIPLALVLIAGVFNVIPVRASASITTETISGQSFLNEDGTLKLDENTSASFQVDAWNVQLDPDRGPIFSPRNQDNYSPLVAATTAGTWSALGSNLAGTDGAIYLSAYPSGTQVLDIAVSGTDIYVVGCFTDAGGDSTADYVAKWDGTSWSGLGNDGRIPADGAVQGCVQSIAVSGNDVYIGTGGAVRIGDYYHPLMTSIAKWDGATWSAVGAENAITTWVNSIVIMGSDVYVGGNFTDVKNGAATLTAADYIAKWDGTNWSALGSGFSGNGALNGPQNGTDVQAIAVYGSDLYVGGNFTQVVNGSTPDFEASYIAKWDGTNWSAVGNNGDSGPSLNKRVSTIAVNGSDLYVGGSFTDVKNGATTLTAADYVTKWDGADWSALGSNGSGNGALYAEVPNAFVTSIVASDGDIYVAGNINVNNNGSVVTAADYVTKWDGANWSALGSDGNGNGSLNNGIYSLAISSDQLYAGGVFKNVNNNGTVLATADYIAAYGLCTSGPITVQNTNDSGSGSLRQTIADICSGDTINFDPSLSGQTIYLASTLTLSKDVTIDGSALDSQITISGDSDQDTDGDVRVFYVGGGVTATLDSLIVTKGWSLDGGSGLLNDGTLTLMDSLFSASIVDNNAGGGIKNNAIGVLTITDSTISGNHAWNGGAIGNFGQLTITNSTISGNTSGDAGGGIFSDGPAATLTVTNTTFSGNTASTNGFGSGGGIFSSGSLTVKNSTFSGNSAAYNAGGIAQDNGTLNFSNTIIANSVGGDCYRSSATGVNLNNLVEDGSCANIPSGDPLLDNLANNGGPTQTFALLANSPAIDAGDDATCVASPVSNLDQRGTTRPDGGHCDIGAFEYVDTSVPIVTAFNVPTSPTSLDIPITTFAVSEDAILTGYLITESATSPAVGDPDWTATAPTTYPVPSMGSYTLYPWAKDAAGHVSAVYGSPATANITCLTSITVMNNDDSGAGSLRQALADACVGDINNISMIDFDSALSGDTIHLTSELLIAKNVTIDGSDLTEPITISGDDTVRVFNIPTIPLVTRTITLDSLIVTNGATSGHGAGLFMGQGMHVTITNSTFSDNHAGGRGGGIGNQGSLTLVDSTVSGNSAAGELGGGGISNESGLTMTNSTISNNTATGSFASGGGLFNTGGATITNSTIFGNSSNVYGGGISTTANLTITNSTIAGNSAAFTGGLQVDGNVTHLRNTIIANNTSTTINSLIHNDCSDTSDYPNPPSADGDGIMTNVNNLIEDGSCSPSLSGDPNLGPLADNGGLTQTMALMAGSSAIDAGDDTICAGTNPNPVNSLDQRGVARPLGSHCDIGAYEFDVAYIDVTINGSLTGAHTLGVSQSARVSYPGINNGPVKVISPNAKPFLVAERDAWLLNGVVQSFSEMMGLPASQVTDTYYFPWYNNVTMDTQLRFANLGAVPTDITVTIAGVAQLPITVAAGQSTRVSYAGINAGPVKVQSSGGTPIIVAERDAWLINGVVQSFSEMMGLSGNQLTDTYYFPWYNNVTMDTQLRFANLGVVPTDITVTIAGVAQQPITVAAGQSARISYPGINAGPVQVQSTGGTPIIVAERDAWLINGVVRSFSEMMGLPANQLTETYYFPWYNNVTMDTQLRFANLGNTSTDITVTIAGVAQPPVTVAAGMSTRISYPGINNGPVKVESSGGVPIIAAERDAWLLNGAVRSFSEMMGLPGNQLTTTYYFPWYNNVTMDTQLRFAVP